MRNQLMKSWARNLLMLDLTFGPSFKVKRWFTGFGELSFRWIQLCIGSPMRRSSHIIVAFITRAFLENRHFTVMLIRVKIQVASILSLWKKMVSYLYIQ